MDESVLLTTEEVARALQLKPQTCRKWRLVGFGPRYLKIGGRVRYALADLNEFLGGCAAHNTAEVRAKKGGAQ